jgi:hypothetical protein
MACVLVSTSLCSRSTSLTRRLGIAVRADLVYASLLAFGRMNGRQEDEYFVRAEP